MEWPRNRKWFTVALLGMVVPLSLLVTFKFTGILYDPTVRETVVVDTVSWNMERPYSNEFLWAEAGLKTAQNKYTDGDVAFELEIAFCHYIEHYMDYDNHDYINMNVSMTANVHNGRIERAYFAFLEDYGPSQVVIYDLDKKPTFYSLENLSITSWACGILKEKPLEEGVKAFVDTAGLADSSEAYFSWPVHWILRSPNNHTETLEIKVEITYFKENTRKKTVLPIELNVTADPSCSFETAVEITDGTYKGYLGGKDSEDFYKIWAEDGQTISVQMIFEGADFDLQLYTSQKNLVASSENHGDIDEQIAFVADYTGWWFIKTYLQLVTGRYILQVALIGD